jgi:hypothetical protein
MGSLEPRALYAGAPCGLSGSTGIGSLPSTSHSLYRPATNAESQHHRSKRAQGSAYGRFGLTFRVEAGGAEQDVYECIPEAQQLFVSRHLSDGRLCGRAIQTLANRARRNSLAVWGGGTLLIQVSDPL